MRAKSKPPINGEYDTVLLYNPGNGNCLKARLTIGDTNEWSMEFLVMVGEVFKVYHADQFNALSNAIRTYQGGRL